jgi:hypothetical protein
VKQPLQLEEAASLKRKECPTPSNEDEFILNSVSNRLQSVNPTLKRRFIHNVRQQIAQSIQDEHCLIDDEFASDSFLGAKDFLQNKHAVSRHEEENLSSGFCREAVVPIKASETSTSDPTEPKVSIINAGITIGQEIEVKDSAMEVDEVDYGARENLFESVASPIVAFSQERKVKRFNLGVQSRTKKSLCINLVM